MGFWNPILKQICPGMADKRMITYIDDVETQLGFYWNYSRQIFIHFHEEISTPSPPPTSHLVELCLLYLKLKRVLDERQVRICCSKQIKEIQKEMLTFDYFWPAWVALGPLLVQSSSISNELSDWRFEQNNTMIAWIAG